MEGTGLEFRDVNYTIARILTRSYRSPSIWKYPICPGDPKLLLKSMLAQQILKNQIFRRLLTYPPTFPVAVR
jgi:hypothetical protein